MPGKILSERKNIFGRLLGGVKLPKRASHLEQSFFSAYGKKEICVRV